MKKYFIIFIFIFINPVTCHANYVEINEVLPNPKGQDKNNEWIEIFNNSNKNVNLNNWEIRNSNKYYKIKSEIIIPPKKLLTISNLKITLKNKEEKIYLVNNEDKIIDHISYRKAPEGLSYSKITIIKGNIKKYLFNWKTPTKNKQNPIYLIEISKIRDIKNNKIISDKHEIILPEKFFNKLNKLLLKKGNYIKTLSKIDQRKLILESYYYLNKPP